jgi:phosphotransacetylase
MLANLDGLLELNRGSNTLFIAVVNAHDEEVIEAVTRALDYNIKSYLIGDVAKITEIIRQNAYDIDKYVIVEAKNNEESAFIGVQLIKENKADFLMKGLIDTKTLLKAVVNSETGIKEFPLLSHISLVKSPHYHKVLFITDCAMVIAPTVDEKVHIINNAVDLANVLGYEKPKVGIVSAIEVVNPKMPSTVDASEIVKRFKLGEIKNAIVDGPFAIDNLVSMESVIHKGLTSVVAGDADILLFPNIEAGNVFYKTVVFLGRATVAGIIVGAKCPIILTSRADSAMTKLYSILLAAVYNYGKNTRN